jgi:hypothetical protein
MKLEEKQQHFEYRTPKDLYVHMAPCSPDAWNARLLKIAGTDAAGDPRLRIVWGGDAKKTGYRQDATGSVEIRTIRYPGPIPKVRECKGFKYIDNDGHWITVMRSDLVPVGKMIVPLYDYFELGVLRWILEMKMTPTELVAAQIYPGLPGTREWETYGTREGRRYKPRMNPRGEYFAVMPIQTPGKRYWEPDEAWFESYAKTVYEDRNATEGYRRQKMNATLDALEKAEHDQELAETEIGLTIVEDAIIEAQKETRGQVHFDQKVSSKQ